MVAQVYLVGLLVDLVDLLVEDLVPQVEVVPDVKLHLVLVGVGKVLLVRVVLMVLEVVYLPSGVAPVYLVVVHHVAVHLKGVALMLLVLVVLFLEMVDLVLHLETSHLLHHLFLHRLLSSLQPQLVHYDHWFQLS